MKAKVLLMFFFAISLICCDTRPNFVREYEENPNKYRNEGTFSNLCEILDPSNQNSCDLGSLLDFKTIDLKGRIKSVDLETATELYNNNIDKKRPDLYPFFEIKNSSNIIIPVFGQGFWDKIWGLVMLDKNSMKVKKIQFEHMAETPGLGAEIMAEKFKKQFIGREVYLSENSFSLYQVDKLEIEGKHRIDGITGATVTVVGVVNMLNEDFKKYENYFR